MVDSVSEPGEKPLNARLVRSSFWYVGARVGDRLIGFVSQIIIARLLFPDDFGLVILAFAVIGIVEVFSEFGFQNAVIYNQTAKRDYYDTAWTMSAIRGVITALIVIGIAYPASLLFDEPRLFEILPFLSIKAVLAGVANIRLHDFEKNLWMSRIFIHLIAGRLSTSIAAICFALYLGNYWALVYGLLLGEVVRLSVSYLLYPYLPRPTLSCWREIMSYSMWLMVSGVLRYFRRQGHTYILGAVGQVSAVGVFQIAYEIAYLASTELVAPMKRALFPGYAKAKAEPAQFKAIFGNSVGITALIAMPIAVGTGLIAHLAIPILLGDRWIEAIGIVQILAAASAVTSVQGHVGPVFLALGKTKLAAGLDAYLGVAYFLCLVPLTYFYGLNGAATTIVTLAVISLFAEIIVMRRLIGFTMLDYFNVCWRATLSCLVMVAVVLFVQSRLTAVEAPPSDIVQLAISIVVGMLSYAGSIFLLWVMFGRRRDSAEYLVFDFFKGKIAKSHA